MSGWGDLLALPWTHCHQWSSCPLRRGRLGEALTSFLTGAGSRAWTPSLQMSLSKIVVPLC